MGFTKGSVLPAGLGVSGGLAYGSLHMAVGEPMGSERPLGDFPDSELRRGVPCPEGGGLGVPTILV